MNLPIKDKNEIIVFFSSDVVRERSPVTQTGYKEGYLTKRGKNFGGWKTRYFVLHGPVLDYYDNVRIFAFQATQSICLTNLQSHSEAARISGPYRYPAPRSDGNRGQVVIKILMTKTSSVMHS